MRVLVMGCGGLGGWIAAQLVSDGHDVLGVTHDPNIAAAINERGFVRRHGDRNERIRGRAVAEIGVESGFDVALLATQPTTVVAAARAALPALRGEAAMVCLQNGVCESRVAEVIGADRVVGAVVGWGASMPQPGVYDRTSEGGFAIGNLSGRRDPRLAAIGEMLAGLGAVAFTDNLLGARWSKLAINCAISALGTIGGDRLGALLRYALVRRMALEAMTEAVLTAQRRGIRLEKIAGLLEVDQVVLTADDALAAASPSLAVKHAILLAVGFKFRRLRSSMLAAIERGREPAVDYLNGEVVLNGAATGVLTPLNHRLQQTVHAIAAGELRPGIELLRRVFDESRDEVRRAAPLNARAADVSGASASLD